MQDVEKYRQYAADCIRIAQKMDANDKQILMGIAEAWEMRAKAAEQRAKTTAMAGARTCGSVNDVGP